MSLRWTVRWGPRAERAIRKLGMGPVAARFDNKAFRGIMTMIMATVKTSHPYIVRQEGVCGGRAIIEGTRIPVWVIAGWAKQGYSPQEIQEMYSWLTLAQIHDALSYYYDHRQEIDEDIQANNPPDEEVERLRRKWQRLSST